MKNRLIFTILFSLAYALARYAWFSDVAAIHIPTYLVNKAIAVVAVFFVFYAALDHKQGRHDRSREWGRLAMQAAFVHVLLSLAILKPGYFETFFGDERLNLRGELVVLFGALAAYVFWIIPRYAGQEKVMSVLKWLGCLLLLFHLLSVGLFKWIRPAEWPGYMPPISLISAVLILGALIAFFIKPKKA
ncbi:MAG: hypothetical protein ACKVG0_14340 [Alphaproteobacteria bacterium]|jgi:hypothetical protein